MAFFKKPAPNHQQGITGLTKPAPIPAAAKRAQSGGGRRKWAILIPALAFVAIGSVAFVALQKISTPQTSVRVYSSAPPSGSAALFMNALKVPHEREKEVARQALLDDEDGPMVVKPLNEVVALTQPDRVYIEETPQPVQALQIQNVEQVAATAPEVVTPEPVVVASAQPENVAPEVAPVAVVDCVDELRTLAASSKIFYTTGSASLDANALRILRVFGQEVENCPTAFIHVTGHSDSVGSEAANMAMSWKRADKVIETLAQLGLESSQFEAVGFGARSPLAQGDSGDDDLNRRVEFHVLQKQAKKP